MLDENGSVRVIAWFCSINCPLRMCQPIPASPSNRDASTLQLRVNRSPRKTRSKTEGISKDCQPATDGRDDEGSCVCELLKIFPRNLPPDSSNHAERLHDCSRKIVGTYSKWNSANRFWNQCAGE